MSEIDWDEAPHDAETYEEAMFLPGTRRFCKSGYWWDWFSEEWRNKVDIHKWKTIATRPQPDIINIEDMKEGMVVMCVESNVSWYKVGETYTVREDEHGDIGPIDKNGHALDVSVGWCKFTLVSEPQPRKTVKDAVEKNEQEWTHTSKGHRCKIDNNSADKRGYITIIREDIGYCVANPADLKPITRKPTISKAEAWDKVKHLAKCHEGDYQNAMEIVEEKYNIE